MGDKLSPEIATSFLWSALHERYGSPSSVSVHAEPSLIKSLYQHLARLPRVIGFPKVVTCMRQRQEQ